METVPFLGQTLRRWRIGASTFLAMPERGARLMNWHLTHADGFVRDILYWPELSSLDNFHKIRGGNPILFPFSARTFDAGEAFHWRDPDGVRRPMPMHGFARQGTFKLSRLDAAGFAAQLVPDKAAHASYPFEYEFTVTYRFAALSLAVEFNLKNLDTRPIPWSAGHHFYFTAPWNDDETRAGYDLRIPATRVVRQDAAGQLEPAPALPASLPLDDPRLVDVIHLGLKQNSAIFGPRSGPGEVRVFHGTNATPAPDAAFVTWTETATSPFFCVEPWMGPPNAPETKTGLHWVRPGQSQSFVVEVKVK